MHDQQHSDIRGPFWNETRIRAVAEALESLPWGDVGPTIHAVRDTLVQLMRARLIRSACMLYGLVIDYGEREPIGRIEQTIRSLLKGNATLPEQRPATSGSGAVSEHL
jgi:hypothetical protein